MAIINCPECGKEISDKSETCIHCGYPLKESMSEEAPKEKDSDEQACACQRKIEEIKASKVAEREYKTEQARIEEEKAAKKRKKTIVIFIPFIIACIAFVILLTVVMIPTIKYNNAISLIEAGKYVEAYETLNGLNGFKDSDTKAKEIFEQYKIEKLKTAQIGDYIVFGTYEQDNNTLNGKEDIEWIVLARERGCVLVISRYALDCQKYNTSYTDVTWETCSLRTWLNETFISNAFSSDEQTIIQSTTVSPDANPSYSTSSGKNTTDKLFLLSIMEANKYFYSDSARKCQATAYAKERGSNTDTNLDTCWWWLRTPGSDSGNAAYGYGLGSIDDYGKHVDLKSGAVRPALWISLDA